MRGRGFFLLSKVFGFILIVFAVLLCRAVLPLLYILQAYQNNIRTTLPGVCTYVRHVSERGGPPATRGVCGVRAVFLKLGGGTLGFIKSPVCNYNHKKLYSIMDLCLLRII